MSPLPPDMTAEVRGNYGVDYFAFAVPEAWERCPGAECRGLGRGTTWRHGDGRLVVRGASSGWVCPDTGQPATYAMHTDASRHLPDAYLDGELSLRVEVPVTASRELDVPNASGAWQHTIVDSEGAEHLINNIYLSGKVLTMYFLYLDDDAVAQVTDTVTTAALDSPWTPNSRLCGDHS